MKPLQSKLVTKLYQWFDIEMLLYMYEQALKNKVMSLLIPL